MKGANIFGFIFVFQGAAYFGISSVLSKNDSVKIEPESLNWKLLSDVRISDKTVMAHSAVSVGACHWEAI